MNQQVGLDPDKNIIVKLSGEITPEEVSQVTKEIVKIAETMEKVYVLMDVTDLKKVPPKAREEMVKYPMPASEKTAVVGASAMVRVMGSLILKVIPSVKASKFFDTREEALAWLAEKD